MTSPPNPNSDRRKKYQEALKYSSIAYELLFLLLIAVFGGRKLDEKYALGEPYFTIGFTLFAIIAYMVRLIYKLKADNK